MQKIKKAGKKIIEFMEKIRPLTDEIFIPSALINENRGANPQCGYINYYVKKVIRQMIQNQTIKHLLVEYKRPWKLFLPLVGLSLLIAGSFYFEAPDWDIPISIIMAFFAYTTAPWSMRVMIERQWRNVPLMLFLTWFSVDGCYWLYWSFKNPEALVFMRDANFPASLSLYGMCGLVWYFKGSLKEYLSEAKELLKLT